jgi:hypothetical protein
MENSLRAEALLERFNELPLSPDCASLRFVADKNHPSLGIAKNLKGSGE